MEMINNKNGVTTESLQEIVRATAAIPSSRGIMIQSELHSDMERQAEMTCPPIGEENE